MSAKIRRGAILWGLLQEMPGESTRLTDVAREQRIQGLSAAWRGHALSGFSPASRSQPVTTYQPFPLSSVSSQCISNTSSFLCLR